MEISSANLQAFYALAQEQNFSRAAKRLALSQPAFSQRIMNLERQLEVTLVVRHKSGLSLTEAGEKLLRYCEVNRQIEGEFLSDFADKNSGRLAGTIRVGGFSSVMRSLLLPALAPLLRAHPELSVQTFTVEIEEIWALLKSSRVDFAISSRPFEKEGIENVLLGFEENVLVTAKRESTVVTYLDHDEDDLTTAAYFALTGEAAPRSRRYLDDVYGLVEGVRLGLGRAVLPRHLIAKAKDLKVLKPRTVLRTPVYLVHRRAPYHTGLHRLTVKAIGEHFSRELLTL